MNTDISKKTILTAVGIMASSIFLGLWVHGIYMAKNRSTDAIAVTGSAKRHVTSDLAKWTAGFTKQATLFNLKETLTQSNVNRDKIKQFIIAGGILESAITFLPIQTDPIFEQKGGYGYSQDISGYNIRQEVRVESADLDVIDALAKNASKLIDQGIVADYQRTEYFYTKLADLRPELFADATKDAQQRAEAIARGTGVKVGAIRSARTGVIQVLSPNSIDIADYGAYDLSTREKDISATVNVSFSLE